MKCPKCHFTSFDHIDKCIRCGTDLTDWDKRLNLFESPHEEAELLQGKGIEEEENETEAFEVVEKGGFWIRLLAFIFDFLFLNLISVLLLAFWFSILKGGKVTDSSELLLSLFIPYYFLTIFTSLSYYTILHGTKGQTLGKKVFGLRVVHISGRSLGFSQAFVRWVGYILCALTLNIGFLWIVFDKNKQGWHDRIANSFVVRAKRDSSIFTP